MKKTALLWLLVLLPALLHDVAVADSYPAKLIKIIVPYPAGGPADQRSRQLGERLSKALGQPVVIENRPGASGAIGAAAVAKAPADGYTLLWGTLYDLVINPVVDPTLSYDPLRDFAPITQVVSAHLVLDARPGLGVNSMRELIALAKAKPGQLSCGSAGNGTAPHFALEVLKRSANVDIIHVPFKGDAPLLADMLGGHVNLGFNVTTTALPHIKAGKLVPLAVGSPRRLAPLPEVPTMGELGFPELEMTLWGGVLAPAATPAPIINRLNAELAKIINSAEVQALWASGGAQGVATSPEEFAALIRSEQSRWARLIKDTGVKMQ